MGGQVAEISNLKFVVRRDRSRQRGVSDYADQVGIKEQTWVVISRSAGSRSTRGKVTGQHTDHTESSCIVISPTI